VARGYPDFSGATAFPTRKHFKTQSCLVGAIADGVTANVFSLSGQTIIEGGFLTLWTVALLNMVIIIGQIDGSIVSADSLGDAKYFERCGENNHIYTISLYDPDLFTAELKMQKNYYCGYEYILRVFNNTGFAMTPGGEIWYSDVT